ncbi:uncharacterized protein BKCO1_26000135 [Diplodia corticola]|uniref:Uncharacterized protein n=1 Tax=Diplodia corticola TaxID=236234 RepID=A0A1J9R0Z1_9PEZI|nr:uncharacterized protein BKCO1_26000135 [Diplodia corticola]OJD33906.1 hypothetical protein BKCO1_26000135 [Diplodia corticola]
MSSTLSTKAPSTGLLASRWATKPSESTAPQPIITTGLLTSRRAKSTPSPTAGPTKSKWASEPTPTEPKVVTTKAETATTEVEAPKAEVTEVKTAATTSTELQAAAPKAEPKQEKKSWADLVDEDDDVANFVFNLPELNKENIPLQQKDQHKEATAATPTTTTKESAASATPTTTEEEPTKRPQTKDLKPPPSMLASRWSDADCELPPAQSRAEYRATHEQHPTNNNNNNNNNNKKKAPRRRGGRRAN